MLKMEPLTKRTCAAEIGVGLLLTAVVWVVFGQTLTHDFINYDDTSYVTQNSLVKGGLSAAGFVHAFIHAEDANWHPLTVLSHMLDCQLYGLDAAGHHFTNVFLHTVAVILLFILFHRTTGSLWRSAFVGALFAIHPLHVESVAWVSERKDLLSGVFFMLTLCAYVRYTRNPTLSRYTLVSILFLLGLLSKPMLVTVPFVLLLLDYWPLQRFGETKKIQSKVLPSVLRQSNSTALILEKIPLLAFSAASCVATVVAQRNAISSFQFLTLRSRIWNAIMSYAAYVWQMVIPTKLAVFYPYPQTGVPLWQFFAAGTFLVTVTAVVFTLRNECRYLFVGWLWYLVMLVPVIGLVQVGIQARADRYTYLPQIGLFLALTWAITETAGRSVTAKRVLHVVASLGIGIVTYLAWVQTSYWKDSESLWRHALAVTSNNSEANKYLATALVARGHFEEGVFHYTQALAICPEDVTARDDLGIALIHLAQPSEAVAQWEKSLTYDPNDPNAQQHLAWVFATAMDPALRDGQKAVDLAQRALHLFGNHNAIIFRTLAAAYAEAGRFADATAAGNRALELAVAQKNVALADEIQRNIFLYKANLPLRDNLLKHAPGVP